MKRCKGKYSIYNRDPRSHHDHLSSLDETVAIEDTTILVEDRDGFKLAVFLLFIKEGCGSQARVTCKVTLYTWYAYTLSGNLYLDTILGKAGWDLGLEVWLAQWCSVFYRIP